MKFKINTSLSITAYAIFLFVLIGFVGCKKDPYKASGVAVGLTGKYVGPVFGYEVGDPVASYYVEVLPSTDTTVILRSTALKDLEVLLREVSDNEVQIVDDEFVEAAFYRSTNRLYMDKKRSSAFVFNGIKQESQ